MKQFFLTTLSLFFMLFATAQTTDVQLATLQHGDKTTIFSGPDAFVAAYNAAADSLDIITLSSGIFNAPGTISKQIRVYGAGYTTDSITGTKPTIIRRSIILKHRDTVNEDGYDVKAGIKVDNSYFEGLHFDYHVDLYDNTLEIKNVTFKRCNVGNVNIYTSTENVNFINCVVRGSYYGYGSGDCKHNNLYITNGSFSNLLSGFAGSIYIDHCVCNSVSSAAYVQNSVILNSLVSSSISESNIFVKSIPSDVTQNKESWANVPLQSIFVEGTYENDKWLNYGGSILKYPNKYIGNDGTQVGLYGGLYPFGRIPSTPRIVESSIDTKTSVDGKLKVSIKAEAQTKY